MINKDRFHHFLYAVSQRVPSWLFKFNAGTIFYSEDIKLTCRNPKNFRIRPGTADDIPAIAKLTGSSLDFLRRRQQSGDPCFVTITDPGDEIVTVQWSHLGSTFIRGFNLYLDLDPDAAYLYGAFSHPRVRLTGIFNTAFQTMLDHLEEKQARCFWCLVEFFNKPAKLFHQRLRFKCMAEVTYTKFLFLRFNSWHDCRTGKTRYSVSVREPANRDTI